MEDCLTKSCHHAEKCYVRNDRCAEVACEAWHFRASYFTHQMDILCLDGRRISAAHACYPSYYFDHLASLSNENRSNIPMSSNIPMIGRETPTTLAAAM